MYHTFEDILDDFNFVQIVTEPTQQDNILDLVLVPNPMLVSTKITCILGLNDHDIVCVETGAKPTQTKQIHREIYLYNKAEWTTIRSRLKDNQTKFLFEHHWRPVEHLWSGHTEKPDQLTDQCILSKVIKGKPSFPWISREIKKLMQKRNRLYKAHRRPGPSCSKLTTSLVNDSLKFTSSDTQIC